MSSSEDFVYYHPKINQSILGHQYIMPGLPDLTAFYLYKKSSSQDLVLGLTDNWLNSHPQHLEEKCHVLKKKSTLFELFFGKISRLPSPV